MLGCEARAAAAEEGAEIVHPFMVTVRGRGWVTLPVPGSAGVWLTCRAAAMVRGMPRQRLALAVLLAASFTLAVDFSILNVALPVIGADVGLGLARLQWIATSFALCAAGLTLLFGRIADLFGRRRLFLVGMALLGVGVAGGGLATRRPCCSRRAPAGARDRRGHSRRVVAAHDHVRRGPAARAGAGPRRRADRGRLHDRRGARWAADRRAELALGVLRQPGRGGARAGGRSGGAGREPPVDAAPARIAGAVLVTLALLAAVYGIVTAPVALLGALPC